MSHNLYIKYVRKHVGLFIRPQVSFNDTACSPADDSDAAPQERLTPDFFNFKYLPVGKIEGYKRAERVHSDDMLTGQ